MQYANRVERLVQSIRESVERAAERRGEARDGPQQSGGQWRKRRASAILMRCRTPDRKMRLVELLAMRYGAALLAELSDAQVDEVFRTVFTWRL